MKEQNNLLQMQMDVLYVADVFENIREEVVELNANSQNTITVFNKEITFPEKCAPKLPDDKNIMKKAFYQITGISPLHVYLDELTVGFKEEGIYDRHIKSMYYTYTKEWGGFWPILPCMLCNDLFAWISNTFFVYPYSLIMYSHNPQCVRCSVKIVFRKTMVTVALE